MKKLPILIVATIALAGLGACDALPEYQLAYDDARAAGRPIVISNISVTSPNSAGGVDLYVVGKNVSGKTMKYLDYNMSAYNAVGDRVQGTIRRTSVRSLRETGPVAPNKWTSQSAWSNAWYNHSIVCAQITRLSITFTDGTSNTYSSDTAIRQLLAPGVSNSCRV